MLDLFGRYQSALQAKQVELATSALRVPSGHDLFEYGRVCGLYQGLQMALDILNEMQRDQAAKDRAL